VGGWPGFPAPAVGLYGLFEYQTERDHRWSILWLFNCNLY